MKELKKLPPASSKGMWNGINEDLVMIYLDSVEGSNDRGKDIPTLRVDLVTK